MNKKEQQDGLKLPKLSRYNVEFKIDNKKLPSPSDYSRMSGYQSVLSARGLKS